MLYYVLKKLEERGLVTSAKSGGKTVFIVEDPEKLYDLLAKREQEAERAAEAVRELIPRLRNRYRLAGKRPVVRTFEGIEAYEKALEDLLLAAPNEVRAYEAFGEKRTAIETRNSADRRRTSRKIQKRVLFFETTAALTELKKRKYDDYTQFRAIAKGSLAPFAIDLTLYAGKLLYTSHIAQEPTAVLIEDHALYEAQVSLFDAAWKEAHDRTLAYTEK
jgi:sugar-specific transcriptional regulator TrmB